MNKIFKNLIIFIFISLILLNILSFLLLDGFYIRSDWGIGEYLINYSNGFLRRGLLGSFYLDLYNYNPLFLDYAVYIKILAIILLLYLITKDLNFYSKVLIFLIPSGILFFSVDTNTTVQNFYRKELLIYFFYFLYIFILFKNNFFIKQKKKYLLITVIFLLLNYSLIFYHEATLFFSIPSLITVIIFQNKLIEIKKINKYFFFYVIICLVTFLFIILKKTLIANINLLDYLGQLELKKSILEPAKMMAHFSFDDHVNMLISNIHYLAVSFISFLFFFIIYTLSFFLILNIKNNYLDLRVYLFTILIVTTSSFPLFLLGWDYGRWYYSVFIHSMIMLIYIYKVHEKKNIFKYYRYKNLIYKNKISPKEENLIVMFLLFISLNVNFGHCCGDVIKLDMLILIAKKLQQISLLFL